MNITIDNKKYQLNLAPIKLGDKVYNPLSNVIMVIDEEDDILYVNENYYLISE